MSHKSPPNQNHPVCQRDGLHTKRSDWPDRQKRFSTFVRSKVIQRQGSRGPLSRSRGGGGRRRKREGGREGAPLFLRPSAFLPKLNMDRPRPSVRPSEGSSSPEAAGGRRTIHHKGKKAKREIYIRRRRLLRHVRCCDDYVYDECEGEPGAE